MQAANAKTVLVVEDDPDISGLLDLVLSAEGYTVVLAANGLQGLEAAELKAPDLILLDLAMPVMDGREFGQRWMARHNGNGKVPLVIMTARDYDPLVLTEMHASGWLKKPFDLKRVVRLADELTAGGLASRPKVKGQPALGIVAGKRSG